VKNLTMLVMEPGYVHNGIRFSCWRSKSCLLWS